MSVCALAAVVIGRGVQAMDACGRLKSNLGWDRARGYLCEGCMMPPVPRVGACCLKFSNGGAFAGARC
jgi:hypothetical protein